MLTDLKPRFLLAHRASSRTEISGLGNRFGAGALGSRLLRLPDRNFPHLVSTSLIGKDRAKSCQLRRWARKDWPATVAPMSSGSRALDKTRGETVMRTIASALLALLVIVGIAGSADAFDAKSFYQQVDRDHN